MSISAAQVKELRERTGSGMMECKKALVEVGGDIDAAVDHMRKSGLAKADKRSGKTAAEGTIIIKLQPDGKRAVIVEVNCETDFVTRGDDFTGFAAAVADCALATGVQDAEALLQSPMGASGKNVEQVRQELVARIGENISVRRVTTIDSDGGLLATYLHGSRIGVVVDIHGGDNDLARDVAMHVAASRPVCVEPADVSEETIAKEREIFTEQARDSGKPDNIVEKIIDGRIRKFLAEITLTGQAFVKDTDITVGKLLEDSKARVASFVRFEVGEGIEKKKENFAEEVMSQIRGD